MELLRGKNSFLEEAQKICCSWSVLAEHREQKEQKESLQAASLG